MPLIMGILAQAAAAPGPTPGVAAYDLLETEILTAATTASVTFSSLDSYTDYQHLQLRITARATTQPDPTRSISLRANGDSGSNYAAHRLNGNGSSVNSYAYTSQQQAYLGQVAGSNASANVFGALVIDILDFSNASKNTTFRSFSGIATNEVNIFSGLWNNTAAVTSLTIFCGGDNLGTGSRLSLYGLRSA